MPVEPEDRLSSPGSRGSGRRLLLSRLSTVPWYPRQRQTGRDAFAKKGHCGATASFEAKDLSEEIRACDESYTMIHAVAVYRVMCAYGLAIHLTVGVIDVAATGFGLAQDCKCLRACVPASCQLPPEDQQRAHRIAVVKVAPLPACLPSILPCCSTQDSSSSSRQ